MKVENYTGNKITSYETARKKIRNNKEHKKLTEFWDGDLEDERTVLHSATIYKLVLPGIKTVLWVKANWEILKGVRREEAMQNFFLSLSRVVSGQPLDSNKWSYLETN